jgi:hypothetical protein
VEREFLFLPCPLDHHAESFVLCVLEQNRDGKRSKLGDALPANLKDNISSLERGVGEDGITRLFYLPSSVVFKELDSCEVNFHLGFLSACAETQYEGGEKANWNGPHFLLLTDRLGQF